MISAAKINSAYAVQLDRYQSARDRLSTQSVGRLTSLANAKTRESFLGGLASPWRALYESRAAKKSVEYEDRPVVVERDVYGTRDVYGERAVYETRGVFEDRDVFEARDVYEARDIYEDRAIYEERAVYETRAVYEDVAVYEQRAVYETHVNGTRDLRPYAGISDAGIQTGAAFTVAIGDAAAATIKFDSSTSISVTANGATQTFSFAASGGGFREGLASALNSVAGLQAGYTSAGQLQLQTANAQSLTIRAVTSGLGGLGGLGGLLGGLGGLGGVIGAASPLASLGLTAGRTDASFQRYEQVQTGTERMQTGTEDVQVGTEQVETGTERVVAGSEQVLIGSEQVLKGSERVQVGTQDVQTGSERYVTQQERYVSGREKVTVGTERVAKPHQDDVAGAARKSEREVVGLTKADIAELLTALDITKSVAKSQVDQSLPAKLFPIVDTGIGFKRDGIGLDNARSAYGTWRREEEDSRPFWAGTSKAK